MKTHKAFRQYGGDRYLHKECPVTTPFDKRRNQRFLDHGTCGVGFGETLNREENHTHLHVEHLLNSTIHSIKLAMVITYILLSLMLT